MRTIKIEMSENATQEVKKTTKRRYTKAKEELLTIYSNGAMETIEKSIEDRLKNQILNGLGIPFGEKVKKLLYSYLRITKIRGENDTYLIAIRNLTSNDIGILKRLELSMPPKIRRNKGPTFGTVHIIE